MWRHFDDVVVCLCILFLKKSLYATVIAVFCSECMLERIVLSQQEQKKKRGNREHSLKTLIDLCEISTRFSFNFRLDWFTNFTDFTGNVSLRRHAKHWGAQRIITIYIYIWRGGGQTQTHQRKSGKKKSRNSHSNHSVLSIWFYLSFRSAPKHFHVCVRVNAVFGCKFFFLLVSHSFTLWSAYV